MALVDRSKFKSTPIAKMEAEDDKVSNQIGTQKGNGRVNQHKIKEGVNIFRLCPAHPDFEEASSVETKVVRFLPYMKKDREADGKVKTNKHGDEILVKTVKPIWDGRVHGGAPKDLVDEYEKIAKKYAEQTYEKEADRKKYMEPIVGNTLQGGRVKGIAPRQTWVAYAYSIDKNDAMVFGELEFGKAVRQQINKIAGTQQGANDPAASDDCFTNVDDGRSLKITYRKDAQPNDKYVCSIDTETIKVKLENGKLADILKTYPLDDAQVEELLSAQPLIDYRSMFKRSDFEFQLEGLRMFEEEFNFGILNSDEFQDIIAELEEFWPKEEAEGEDAPAEEAEGDHFDLMSKAELKQYAVAQKAQILIKPTMSDVEIRDLLRAWEKSVEEAGDESEAEVTDDFDPAAEDSESEVEPEAEVEPTVTASTLRGQAGSLRNRFAR
jgi:hypothetical protein